MSTKIWEAYKLKDPSDLWGFVRYVRAKATDSVERKFLEIETELIDSVDVSTKEFKDKLNEFNKDNRKNPEERAKRFFVSKLMNEGYKEATASSYRDIFNFDVSIAFREHKGEIYLIPHCDMWMKDVLRFLVDDDKVEDFHYQNQSDPPQHIPPKEFERRGKIWDAIDSSGWMNSLFLEIMSYEIYYMHNPDAQRFRYPKI